MKKKKTGTANATEVPKVERGILMVLEKIHNPGSLSTEKRLTLPQRGFPVPITTLTGREKLPRAPGSAPYIDGSANHKHTIWYFPFTNGLFFAINI